MTGLEAPVIAAIIGGVTAIATTTVSAISANKQADKQAAAQKEYQQQLLAQQQAEEAEEKRIKNEAAERNRAYGASLLDSNSMMSNMLTDSWSDEEADGTTLLSGAPAAASDNQGVTSMFA